MAVTDPPSEGGLRLRACKVVAGGPTRKNYGTACSYSGRAAAHVDGPPGEDSCVPRPPVLPTEFQREKAVFRSEDGWSRNKSKQPEDFSGQGEFIVQIAQPNCIQNHFQIHL